MIPRAATPSDAPEILALWNRMIRETTATFTTQTHSLDRIESLIGDRPGAFHVIGTPARGFMTWGPFRPGPGYAQTAEHTIITAPGEGLGSLLMQHGLKAAAEQGVHAMIAAISAENPRAMAFHIRHGFSKVGDLPQVGYKSGRWIDLILMEKLL